MPPLQATNKGLGLQPLQAAEPTLVPAPTVTVATIAAILAWRETHVPDESSHLAYIHQKLAEKKGPRLSRGHTEEYLGEKYTLVPGEHGDVFRTASDVVTPVAP